MARTQACSLARFAGTVGEPWIVPTAQRSNRRGQGACTGPVVHTRGETRKGVGRARASPSQKA